jgi:hypothetical protein
MPDSTIHVKQLLLRRVVDAKQHEGVIGQPSECDSPAIHNASLYCRSNTTAVLS